MNKMNTRGLNKISPRWFTTLRKPTYSNILKILPPKNENFQIKKKFDIFHISAPNIDCEYSLEPPLCSFTFLLYKQLLMYINFLLCKRLLMYIYFPVI